MSAVDYAGSDGSLDCDNGDRPSSRNDEEAARLLPTEHLDIDDKDDTIADPEQRQGAPPRQKVKPFLPSIQRLPIQVMDRLILRTKHRVVAFALFLLLWAAAFVPLLLAGGRPARDNSDRPVVDLSCVTTFWGPKNLCGLVGVDCQPFSGISFAFRCPPGCATVKPLTPRVIGPVEIISQPLVVGTEVYRGDSWVCASAIHAGVSSDESGGCGRVSLVGEHYAYPGSKGRGGLRSIDFNSYFPLSFIISEESDISCPRESRGVLLLVSMLFTAALSLFTTSPSLMFFATMMVGLIHVGFVSDPPDPSLRNLSILTDRASKFAESFVPTASTLVAVYRISVRPTLLGLDAQFEKTLLWLGGFWFGALSNYTFRWLPTQRLTVPNLEQQSSAQASFAVILIILALIITQQIYFFWLERRLLRDLAWYGLFLTGALICLAIPSVELQRQHYVTALLFLPGMRMQTRPSLLYQGILLGLLVHGIARWGFVSFRETPEAFRGEGAFGSLTPVVSISSISLSTVPGVVSKISFTCELPPPSARMNGISVLVNDVERLRRFFTPGGTYSENFTWTRLVNIHMPEYFRFAFIRDGVTLDYTRAGTWAANGTWEMPTT